MAFEQLGLNMIVKGAAQFARDIGYVNSSLIRYSNAMAGYERQIISMAKAEQRAADARVSAAYRSYNYVASYFQKQFDLADKWAQKYINISEKVIAGGQPATSAQKGLMTRYLNLLTEAAYKANPAMENLAKAEKLVAEAVDNLTSKQHQLNEVTNKHTTLTEFLSSALSVMTGNFGKGATEMLGMKLAGAGLTGMVAKLVPQLAAISLVLDVVKIAVDGVVFGFRVVVGAVKLVWEGLKTLYNIIKPIITVLINLGKALLDYAWQGLKAVGKAVVDLATAPFRFIGNGLSQIWEGLKNIVEIAIGMNLERILWGIGQKLREIVSVTVEAGIEFQLLQIRLRGLLQREMSEFQGIPFSASLEVATERAKELSYWISNLAVKSIFSAEAIANIVTLGMAYDFDETQTKELTLATVSFATQMGLGNLEIQRIVENLGQMKAQGKMSGQELRDLARGAFVPVNRVFQVMAGMEELVGDGFQKFAVKAEFAGKSQKQLNKLVKEGVEVYEAIGKAQIDWRDLKAKGTKGDIPVEWFTKAFIKMVNDDFPNAVESASVSMAVLRSNITDFIQSVIGWRVVTPILDVLSGRMNKILTSLMTPQMRNKFEEIGNILAGILEKVLDFFDKRGPDIQKTIMQIINSLLMIARVAAAVFAGDFDKAISETFLNMNWTEKVDDSLKESMFKNIPYYPLQTLFFGDPTDMVNDADQVSEGFREAMRNIVTFVADHKDDILAFIKDPVNYIKEHGIFWIKELATKGFEFLKQKASEALGYISQWWKDNGGTIVAGITNGIQGALQGLSDFIATKFGADNPLFAFLELVKTIIGYLGGKALATTEGTGVPSNQRNPLDFYAGTGIGLGMQSKTFDDVAKAWNNLKESIKKAVDEIGAKITEFTTGKMNEFTKWIQDNVPGYEGFVKLWGTLKDSIKEVAPHLLNVLNALANLGSQNPTEAKGILDALLNLATGLAGIGLQAWAKVVSFELDAIGVFVKIVSPLADGFVKFVGAFASFNESLGKLGGEVIGGDKTGKKSWFQNAADSIAKFLNDFLFDVNPANPNGKMSQIINAFMNSNDYIEADFTQLKDNLVGHSIIPDMMSGIYDSVIGGMDNINIALPGRINSMIAQFQRAIDKINELIAAQARVGSGGGGGGGGTGGGGGSSRIRYATGGSFRIPPGFGNDTWPLGGGHYASSGELITVSPQSMISNTNITRNNNYNLSVSSQQSVSNISNQFDIIKAFVS